MAKKNNAVRRAWWKAKRASMSPEELEKLRLQTRRASYRYRKNHEAEFKRRERSNSLLRAYGITIEQMESMLLAQGNVCAICEAPEPGVKHGSWCVDHCHATGAVRGILCNSCNSMLGMAKDKPAILMAGISYLKKYGS